MSGSTSLNGFKFICVREAIVTVAYEDGTGTNPDGTKFQKWSIGGGSQYPPVKPGDTISIPDAFIRIRNHIDDNDVIMSRLIKVPIPQNLWDAVASLFYQAGIVPLRIVADKLNVAPSIWAIAEFARWYESDPNDDDPKHDRLHEGLMARRIREMSLALDGNYGDISRYRFYDGPPKTTPPQWREFPND